MRKKQVERIAKAVEERDQATEKGSKAEQERTQAVVVNLVRNSSREEFRAGYVEYGKRKHK